LASPSWYRFRHVRALLPLQPPPDAHDFLAPTFAAHGAPNTRNVDGWGVAFHDGRDARLYKEPEPARDSPLLGFIERHLHPTHLLISHIRRATVGGNSLANTQPFVRELGGRVHLFAHNGGFGGIETWFARSVHRFHPVGDTDSEKSFCLLLDRLSAQDMGRRHAATARRAAGRRRGLRR
jgi:predicted glutamine amidotransferase